MIRDETKESARSVYEAVNACLGEGFYAVNHAINGSVFNAVSLTVDSAVYIGCLTLNEMVNHENTALL